MQLLSFPILILFFDGVFTIYRHFISTAGQKRKLDSDANDDFVMPPKRSAPTPQANGGGFARGRDTTTPVAAPARKVENDNLFGKSSRRKDNDRDNVKRRKKNSTKGKTSTKSSKNNDKKSKGADVLTYKQLRVGMVLLCAIKQVNETDLTVALPHGKSHYIVRVKAFLPPRTFACSCDSMSRIAWGVTILSFSLCCSVRCISCLRISL